MQRRAQLKDRMGAREPLEPTALYSRDGRASVDRLASGWAGAATTTSLVFVERYWGRGRVSLDYPGVGEGVTRCRLASVSWVVAGRGARTRRWGPVRSRSRAAPTVAAAAAPAG